MRGGGTLRVERRTLVLSPSHRIKGVGETPEQGPGERGAGEKGGTDPST